ncbi:hypothetical protein KNE206_73630 [Kitasatospora sp. NE20-6]|uniref:terpene synthase family protein n=1 Tax=Kitasatospora sp. NE20-6 TaxID=2859066 RepID=UPI0034DBC780
MKTISIPELESAFASRTSPYADQAEQAARSYVRLMGLLRSAEAAAHYDDTSFGLLAACVYPDADHDMLCLIAEFLAVWAIFDDQLEDIPDGHSMAEFDVVIAGVRSCYEGNAPGGRPANACEEALGELWRRMRTRMSVRWQRRFVEHVVSYLEGTRWEAANRGLRRVPDLESFVAVRRDFGGIRLAMDLAELGGGYELPDDVHRSAQLGKVLDIFGDAALWANDIFSWQVDHAAGNVSNVVTVLDALHGGGVQDAVDRAVVMIRDRLSELAPAEEALRAWLRDDAPQGVCRDVDRYLDGVHTWISGNIHWSRRNERYRSSAPRSSDTQAGVLLTGQR